MADVRRSVCREWRAEYAKAEIPAGANDSFVDSLDRQLLIANLAKPTFVHWRDTLNIEALRMSNDAALDPNVAVHLFRNRIAPELRQSRGAPSTFTNSRKPTSRHQRLALAQ